MSIPILTMYNGTEIPALGLGVWKAEEGDEVEQAITWALDAGYRSIDTAAIYRNEFGVGNAIHRHQVDRSEIFLTTKVWNDALRSGKVKSAFETSRQRLRMEYVDLYLIHWPVAGTFVNAWKDLEDLYEAGHIRAIGVSNFMPEHLDELLASARIKPMINQIEYHPYLQQQDVVDYCQKQGILIEAWSPLMQGNIKDEPVLTELAQKHGRTNAQIALRWNVQKEVVTIPKSTNQGRIQENMQIFDFELSAEDMAKIDGLERGQRFGPDPHSFDF